MSQAYGAGTLSTVEMKDECIKKLQEIVADFQKVRSFCIPIVRSTVFSHHSDIASHRRRSRESYQAHVNDLIQYHVADEQNRAEVTDELVAQFQDASRKIDPFPRKTEA